MPHALAMLLLPLLLPPALVALMRVRALRDATTDPVRAWFTFWMGSNLAALALWLGWMSAFWSFEAAHPGITGIWRSAPWLGSTFGVLVAALPPSLVSLALAAHSHALSERLRGEGWRRRETVGHAAWQLAGLVLPLALLASAAVAGTRGEWRGAAWIALAALASRAGCERMRLGALDLAPHAITTGDLRDRVFSLAAAAGVKLRMLYVMPTERGRLANAFAVNGGIVLLTDHLLRHLTRREVDAVLAHELAHLRRGHPRWLLVPAVAVTTLTFLVAGSADPALVWPVALAVAFLATLLTLRRFEFEADRGALELTRDPDALVSALAALARLNRMPIDWGRWTGVFLTHPSMLQRARAIGRVAGLEPARVATLLREGCGDPARHTLPASAAGKVFSTRFKSEQSARIGFTVAGAMAGGATAAVMLAGWLRPDWPRALDLALAATAAFGAALLAIDLTAARPYARVRRALAARLAAEGIDPAGAHWVGLSPTDRARIHEGFSDWDVGFLFVRGDRLCYVGEETRFAVRREDVVAVRLGARMPGWIGAPRVVVDRRVGTFSLRPADVARVSAGNACAWRLLGVLGAWLDGLDDGRAPQPHPVLDALAPPDPHEVTAMTPREAAHPRGLVAVLVVLGLLAVVASTLAGLPSGLAGRSGFLDAWLASVLAALLNQVPWWRWRERPAAPAAAREEQRRAA